MKKRARQGRGRARSIAQGRLYWTVVRAPGFGPVFLASTEKGLCAVGFQDEGGPGPAESAKRWARLLGREAVRDPRRLGRAARALKLWTAGRPPRRSPQLDLSSVGAFDERVLIETARVPWGRTASYGEIAARIGRPGAARAVGGALGRNPVPVFVPCHRVVAADGGLGGYTGSIERKKALLAVEGAL